MVNINDYILNKLKDCIDTNTFTVVNGLKNEKDIHTAKPSIYIRLENDLFREFLGEGGYKIEIRDISFYMICGFKGATDTAKVGLNTNNANSYIDTIRKNLATITTSTGTNSDYTIAIKEIRTNFYSAVEDFDNDNAVLVEGKINYQIFKT